MTVAALTAALLAWSGPAAFAVSEAPASGWFYTTSDTNSANNPVSLPQSLFQRSPSGALALDGAPFAFAATSSFGRISVSGQSVLTGPYLSSGGLISRDGPAYTMRDVEFADRLSDDSAFEFGYGSNAAGVFDLSDVRASPAYAGIFSSMSGFEQGLGISERHVGATIGLGDGLSFDFGEQLFATGDFLAAASPFASAYDSTMGFDRRQAETQVAGLGWNFAPWGRVALIATHDSLRNGGLEGTSELSLAKSASSTLGASGQISFGGGWVTSFSYNEGVTQLDLRPAGAALSNEQLPNRSYGLAIAKHGLFGDDALGFAVSRPLDQGMASFDLGGAATADPFDGFISSSTRPIMIGTSQPTDVELGYVTTFMDGALALQANAGYQMNAAGQPGNNSLAVLSRAKINF